MDATPFFHVALLLAIGLVAGFVGTVVGFGGGFLAVPLLRLALTISPAEAAGASLVMVVANALSASFAYARQRRTDVRTAILVGIGGFPGAIVGALLVRRTTSPNFDALYGALLVVFFLEIVRRRLRTSPPLPARIPGMRERSILDAAGERHTYGTHDALVIAIGFVLAFASSFFGIGGGVVFVAFFVGMFAMPPHVVVATSTLAILFTAPVGVAAHAFAGDIDWHLAIPLAIGGTVGGQFGPRVAKRLSPPALVTAIGAALVLAGIALALHRR